MNDFQKIGCLLSDSHFLYQEKDSFLPVSFFHFFTSQNLYISNKSVTHTLRARVIGLIKSFRL